MIIEADDNFYSDTLGLTSAGEKQKIRFEISKVKEFTVGKQNLFGWGSNNLG